MNCKIETCDRSFSETHRKLDTGGVVKATLCVACRGLERLYLHRLRRGIRPPAAFRYLTAQVTMEAYERR